MYRLKEITNQGWNNTGWMDRKTDGAASHKSTASAGSNAGQEKAAL